MFYPITREVSQNIANELAERRKGFGIFSRFPARRRGPRFSSVFECALADK